MRACHFAAGQPAYLLGSEFPLSAMVGSRASFWFTVAMEPAYQRWGESLDRQGLCAAIAMDTCGSSTRPHPFGESSAQASCRWRPRRVGVALIRSMNRSQTNGCVTQLSVTLFWRTVSSGSLPEVDADRTGLTGISWGGIIAEIVAGVDGRLKFIVPVYASGFLGEGFLLERGASFPKSAELEL